MGMKNFTFLVVGFLCSMVVFAESSAQIVPDKLQAAVQENKWSDIFTWSLLMSGSWEENKTLHNREEFRLNILPLNLTFRSQILDRRTLNFQLDSPWGDPDKGITHFLGALYHKPTGSRLLFGVIDEWGLSARIRNPWIRSPPYAENHKPLMADIKTAASSTKNDEVYLYLSSPFVNIFPESNFFSGMKLRGFVSAQTEIENFTEPSLAGGVDIVLKNKTGLLFEVFYTGAALPPTKNSSWFSNPPPLPEREFDLYAAGFLFHNPLISISSDVALSETFAWGTDIYGNLGISISPVLPFGVRARPLLFSIAVDGAGNRFVYRDGGNYGEGFRGAAKVEWKNRGNSLLRLNTVLRGPGLGENFNRSSSGFYYRFPANRNRDNVNFIRLTRISFTADRNAVNSQKINDRFYGYMGLSLNLQKIEINTPLGVNLSGSIRGLTSSENSSLVYPFPNKAWNLDSCGINCEFTWSPLKFQFRSRVGYTYNANNDDKWDFSFSSAARFRHGRLSLRALSPDFPEKWNWTISWRLEKRQKNS
jgi:hypothetical protein